LEVGFSVVSSCFNFLISSRSIAWFRDRCWTLSWRSENASLSISISFFTYPKLAETFLSTCFVDFSIRLDGLEVYKICYCCNFGIKTSDS